MEHLCRDLSAHLIAGLLLDYHYSCTTPFTPQELCAKRFLRFASQRTVHAVLVLWALVSRLLSSLVDVDVRFLSPTANRLTSRLLGIVKNGIKMYQK